MTAPIRWPRWLAPGVIVLAGAACSGIENTSSRDLLIPNETLNISKSLSLPLESIAAGAVLSRYGTHVYLTAEKTVP